MGTFRSEPNLNTGAQGRFPSRFGRVDAGLGVASQPKVSTRTTIDLDTFLLHEMQL